MDRFFCALLIGALLLVSAAAPALPADEPAQSVFFSLLFPQLMPGFEEAEMEAAQDQPPHFDEGWWKAVFL